MAAGIDNPCFLRYPSFAPGGSGAAEPFEPCQVREEAAVRRKFRVPPGCLLGALIQRKKHWKQSSSAFILFELGYALAEELDSGCDLSGELSIINDTRICISAHHHIPADDLSIIGA